MVPVGCHSQGGHRYTQAWLKSHLAPPTLQALKLFKFLQTLSCHLYKFQCLHLSFFPQDDPDTLLKCLTIASEMLQGVATSGLNPTLTTLVQTLVITCDNYNVPLWKSSCWPLVCRIKHLKIM